METGKQFLSVMKIDSGVERDTADLESIGFRALQAGRGARGGSESRFLYAADRGLADIHGPSIGKAEMANVKPEAPLHVFFS